MNITLQNLIGQSQSAAHAVLETRVQVDNGTNTQNIFEIVKAFNTWIASATLLLDELTTQFSATQDAVTALQKKNTK